MDDLKDLIKKRVKDMAAESKVGSDAIAKSLRCYETHVHPLFRERLSIWYDELDKRSIAEGRTFTYNSNVEGLTGSNLMNYIFQSFYLQEPEQEVDVIYPRLSTRTSVAITESEGTDIRSEVKHWLGQQPHEDNFDVLSLRTLATQEIGATVVTDLLDNTLNSSFSQGVRSLLFSNDFRFPSNEFLTVAGRCIHQDLIMKVKYYPSRDDNRAYCSDHSRLRSLVASCLNRMISPKSMAIRQRLHSATILRPDKKDILDLHLPKSRDDSLNTYLLLADVSNFTGSFANSWLMVYTMALELASGNLEDRYQLFSVCGKIVEASWKELIMLYLYLTVGVPCWIEALEDFGYLSGGFLGVGSNITIGLLCLAVVLEDVLRRVRRRVLDSRAQAGGDDIAIAIRCYQTELEEVMDTIRGDIEAYVGKLKEFECLCLEDLQDGIIEKVTFCRKRILLVRDDNGTHITGEPSVPLPASLFPQSTQIHGIRNQITAWHELDNSLKSWEHEMPQYTVLADTVRQLFLEHYRSVNPLRSHVTKRLTGHHRIMQCGSATVTESAYMVICTVCRVENRGSVALHTFESQLRYALINELVSLAKVDTGEDELKQVVMTQYEINRLIRTRWIERMCLIYDEELLVELINIVS